MRSDSPLFIVGCDRSGTTLLSLIIDQDESVHVTLESGFIPHLYDHRDEYGDFSSARERWYLVRDLQHTQATSSTRAFDIFELTDIEAERAISRIAPTDFPGAVQAIFETDAQKQGARRWANKTPKYISRIDLLASLFPESRFVHIIRDPRDVSASLVRAGWHASYSEAAEYWVDQVESGLKSGSSLNDRRYFEVQYEELVTKPIEVLRRLSDWAGLQLDSRALKFHEHAGDKIADEHEGLFPLIDRPIDPSRASAWKDEMTRIEIADVERVAAPLMQKLGYEVTGAQIPASLRGIRWSKRTIIRIGRRVKNRLQETPR